MDDARVLELYARSRELRKPLDGNARFAGYVDLPRPEALLDDREPFLTRAQQDLRDLANFVNEFTLNLNVLRAWDTLLPSLDSPEVLPVTMEFINPAAYLCLGAPYALKGRLHTSIAQVSHLANEFVDADWQHVDDYGSSSFDKAKLYAERWESWPSLRGCLGRLDNKPFRRAVYGFRNEYHHGSPRMLEVGFKPFVWRKRGETIVGATPPLAVASVVSALLPQQKACVAAYEAYVRLVHEQLDSVMPNKRFQLTRHGVRYEKRASARS